MKEKTGLAFLFCCCFVSFAFAQTQIPPRLTGQVATQVGEFIEVKFTVNYPGFVQLYLYNSNKECVWIKGITTETNNEAYGRQSGDGVFRISTKPMKAGERYTYVLKYKGKDYTGSFYVSKPAGGA